MRLGRIIFAFLLLSIIPVGVLAIGEGGVGTNSASRVRTSTTNFNSNLSSADTTVQKALDTLDDMAGGSGTPGGNDTEVQFNDGGSFAGDSDFTWNKTLNLLNISILQIQNAAYQIYKQGSNLCFKDANTAKTLTELATDNNTTYTAGDHITLTGTDFDVDHDFVLLTGDTMAGTLDMNVHVIDNVSTLNATTINATTATISTVQIATSAYKLYAQDNELCIEDPTNGAKKLSELGGSVSDGDKGDITVSGSGATWSLDTDLTPQFVRLGLNAASSATSNLFIDANWTIGQQYGINVDWDNTETGLMANGDIVAFKLTADATVTDAKSYGNLYGFQITANDDSTSACTEVSVYGISSIADSDHSSVPCYGVASSATGLGINYGLQCKGM